MGKPYHIWSYWRYLVLQKRPQLFQPSQCSLNDQNRVFHFLLTWPQSEVSPVGHFLSFLHSTSQCSTALQSAALPCTVQQSANMSKPSSVQYSTVQYIAVQCSTVWLFPVVITALAPPYQACRLTWTGATITADTPSMYQEYSTCWQKWHKYRIIESSVPLRGASF